MSFHFTGWLEGCHPRRCHARPDDDRDQRSHHHSGSDRRRWSGKRHGKEHQRKPLRVLQVSIIFGRLIQLWSFPLFLWHIRIHNECKALIVESYSIGYNNDIDILQLKSFRFLLCR